MSTKRISRTILEGGRANVYERRASTAYERQGVRRYERLVKNDVELADEIAPPKRSPVRKEFTDKINPVYQWLDSRVGKSWAKTYKLLKEKFDDRTLAGFHIVHQHIIREIGTETEEKEVDHTSKKYYVDKNNILRKTKYLGHYNFLRSLKTPFKADHSRQMIEWLDNRKIGFIDGVLYWFNCTTKTKCHWISNSTKYKELYGSLEYTGQGFYEYVHAQNVTYGYGMILPGGLNFRQGKKLTKAEVNFYKTLPEWVKEILLTQSPNKKKKAA